MKRRPAPLTGSPFPPQHVTDQAGHGRHDIRVIRAAPATEAISARWPGAEQMFLIERCRHLRTRAMGDISACRAGGGQESGPELLTCARQLGAKVSCEAVTGITSLSAGQASPARLLTHNRHHWGIENGLHHRRDTTYGEDASPVRAGAAPRLLASMNNLVISVLSRAGHANSAYARRDLGWDRTGLRALELLGLLPKRDYVIRITRSGLWPQPWRGMAAPR